MWTPKRASSPQIRTIIVLLPVFLFFYYLLSSKTNEITVIEPTSKVFSSKILNKNLKQFSEVCTNTGYVFGWAPLPRSRVEGSSYKVGHRFFQDDGYEVLTYENSKPQEEDVDKHSSFGYDTPVLFLSTILDKSSYGDPEVRNFKHFLHVLSSLNYNKKHVTIGLSVKSGEEFRAISALVQRYYESSYQNYFKGISDDIEGTPSKFSKIVLVHAPFIDRAANFNRDNRHDANVQKKRRSVLAKIRNFLVNTVLTNEKYTLFIDSDITEVPQNLLNYFIKSGKDIIVPRIQKGKDCFDYDQNSWIGERIEPDEGELMRLNLNKQIKLRKLKESIVNQEPSESLEEIQHDLDVEMDTLKQDQPIETSTFLEKEEQYVYVPQRSKNSKLLLDLSRKIEINSQKAFHYYHPVDSVGGAILFVKSIIFKQGIQFPPLYIVGADWQRVEGYDGIETEGLCYQAQILGYQCWAAPDVLAQHYDS